MKFLDVNAKNSHTILLQAVYSLFYHDDSNNTRYTFNKFKVIRRD